MDSEVLISVENLSHYYGHYLAVDSISFELGKGEVLGFLGPNGAGKSTTMQMLTGNLAPGSGRIHINGIDLLDNPKQAKASIGYLPEQPPVYRDLTVDEYLSYCARLHRVPGSQRGKAITRARQRCGLDGVGRRLIGNLSKGFQQRVGIAQAILHNPAIVILDEPTVGLDPNQIRDIRALIRELGESHGIILSTHILPEVQATCSTIQIIHHGTLVYSETMNSLEQQLAADTYRLETRTPMDELQLQTIPGIDTVELTEPTLARLHFSDGQPGDAIASRVSSSGWGMVELTLERHTLEQVFANLTCSEMPADSNLPSPEQAVQ